MDMRESFEQQRERAEKRLRRDTADARIHSHTLSPGNREILSAFQRRLDGIDALVEAAVRRTAETLDAFDRDQPPPNRDNRVLLRELPVRALHKMDAAGAELRHSIAQAALGSLRMLAQQLPEKRAAPGFLDTLERAFGRMDAVAAQVQAFFAYEVSPGVPIRALLPDVEQRVAAALDDLNRAGPSAAWRPASDDWAQAHAARIVRTIDAVLESFIRVGRQLDAIRVSLAEVVQDVFDLYHNIAAQKGIAFACSVEQPRSAPLAAGAVRRPDRVFADRPSLKNALGELVNNACRHGFPASHQGPRHVRITVCALPEKDAAAVIIADTGCGVCEQDLAALVARTPASGGGHGLGMSRRIIERDHLGKLTMHTRPGEGTRMQATFPRRLTNEMLEDA